ncbi:MAG: hypothetical protein GY865_03430 [candidate division Zixibacteria bacterium]|nr:hypothetical protein [candidate division Zixibacteria bacterium]
MFRSILISLLLVVSMTAIFCSRNPSSYVSGDEVTLPYGQTATFGPDKIKIKFNSVITESRCPDNPIICCFWQGMAAIQISLITQENDTVNIVTSIEGLTKYPEMDSYPAVDTLGLSIELLQLDPYPTTTVMSPHSEYKALLRVKPSTSVSGVDGRVLIIGSPANNLLRDSYTVDSAKIEDDLLSLTVGYSGGCNTHYFYAYVDGSIMKSNPPQINMYLHHFGNNDACDAYLHKNLTFDLIPLAEYYRHYKPGGEFIINIYEYLAGTPQIKYSLPYYIEYPPD